MNRVLELYVRPSFCGKCLKDSPNKFQGIVVSILYCFMSADVRLALAKKYYRLKVRWKSRNLRGENTANHEVRQLVVL